MQKSTNWSPLLLNPNVSKKETAKNKSNSIALPFLETVQFIIWQKHIFLCEFEPYINYITKQINVFGIKSLIRIANMELFQYSRWYLTS